MKAIIKRVGEPAVEFDGDLTYDFMNSTVGGYIQMVPIGPNGIEVVCNEEGMFCGPDGGPLAQNAAGFLGNVLIVAVDGGSCRDMTEEELRKGFRYLEVFANVKHPGEGLEAQAILVGDEAEKFMEQKTRSTLDTWASL